METRVSTQSFFQSTMSNALRVQTHILDISQQVSSGVKTQDFQGLNGQVTAYATVLDKLAKADAFKDSNTLASSRLETTSKALGNIIETANNAKNLILQGRNSTEAGSLAFDQQLRGYFQQIAQQLNSTDESGAYLFSGTRTSQAPIDAATFSTTLKPGVPDNSYYQGNDGIRTATIAENITVSINVPGDHPGMQQIMAGFATAKAGFDSHNDELMQKAYTLMEQGITAITTAQTSVNATAAQITQTDKVSAAQVSYLNTLRDDTVNSDIVSLSAELARDQGVLQASFQAFARVNSLNLSNFLSNA